MTRPPKDLRELAGLYALDALESEDAAEFERFLATSPEARREVAEFERTAATLAGAEATAPPIALKAAVMAEIDITRQERPHVVSLDRARVSALSVAVAAALVFFAGLSVVLGVRLRDARDDNQILAAPDAVTVSLHTTATPNLRVVWSAERGEAAVVSGETSTRPSDVYQLWNLTPSGEAQSIGVFQGGDGVTVHRTDGIFAEPHEFAVTIEPPGGSPQPTGEIVAGPVPV